MKTYDEEMLARWFGAECDPDAAQLALVTLDIQFKRRFGVALYKTPGYTGLMAWHRRWGKEWPPLPPDLQILTTETARQGRFECCPVVNPLPAAYCLDKRFAYAAAAYSIKGAREWRYEKRPVGGWTDSSGEPAVPGFHHYAPGRYRVRFVVRDGWSHAGILSVLTSAGREWPSFPGAEGEAWADARELGLAISNGWRVEILERLIGIKEGKSWASPLCAWVETMTKIREECCRSAHPELFRTAIRNVVLQAIGLFAYKPKTEVRTVASREDLPGHRLGEETFRATEDGVEFEDYAHSGRMAGILHPEFAASIWALTRSWLLHYNAPIGGQQTVPGERTLLGALQLPRDQVLGFAQDCIVTTHDPGWPDDGKDGRYRVKWHLDGPLPAPKNMSELYALGKRAG